MSVLLPSLIDQVRKIVDRVNDPTLSDETIIEYLNDAQRSLYDIFIEAAPQWTQSSVDFTLTGNSEASSTVALPTDFQVDLGLDWLDAPGAVGPVTVRRLPTFQDRNALNYSGASFVAPFQDRNYAVQGDDLRVYPPQYSSGTYRLWYQKQVAELALPITVEFDIATGDQPQVPPPGSLAGTGAWLLANAAFNADIPEDSSVILNLSFEAPNASFSGAYPIVEIGLASEGFGTPTASCDNLASTSGYTNPASGTGSYTYQPIGTRADLPQFLTPWQIYIKTFAAISVLTSFQEDTTALQLRLNAETGRARRMAEVRQSDIRQIPIVGGRRGIDSPNYDSGDFGWD